MLLDKIVSYFSKRMRFSDETQIDTLKNNVLNFILLIVNLFAIPLVVLGVIEAYNLQQYQTAIIYIIFFIPVTIVYIFRNFVPYVLRSLFVIIPCFVLGVNNLVVYGFNGAGIPILLTTTVLTTIFLNVTYSIIMLFSSVLSMTIIGYFFLTKKILLSIELNEISTNLISWITASGTLLLLGIIIIFCIHIIQNNLMHSIRRLLENDVKLKNEIRERKKAEHQIRMDLIERESLINELYHRTMNNMQVIISLMHMKMKKNIDKQDLLLEIINKIEAMALVHNMLYKSNDLSYIKLKDYLNSFPFIVLKSYGISSEQIKYFADIEDVTLSIETAVPLGMIISELITNTIKHAYKNLDKPEDFIKKISIKVSQENELLHIHYRDNGIGVDPAVNLTEINTTGIKIIYGLITHQLQGKISYNGLDGLNWYLTINSSNSALKRTATI